MSLPEPDSLCVGDHVQPMGPIGLAPLYGPLYIVDIRDEECLVSRTQGGPPLLDDKANPKWLPLKKFRREPTQVAAA